MADKLGLSSPQGAGLPIVRYRQLEALPGVCQAVQLAWKRLWLTASTLSRHVLSDIMIKDNKNGGVEVSRRCGM